MKNRFFSLLVFCSCAAFSQQQKAVFYFDFDKDSLNNKELQRFNNWLTPKQILNILKIEGFADKTGVDIYNINLTERRIAFIIEKLEGEGYSISSAKNYPHGEKFAKAAYSAPDRKIIITYEEKPQPEASIPPAPKPTAFTEKVKQAAVGEKVRVPNLNFYNNSDIVLPESEPALKELLQILLDNPDLKIDIQGHICCQKNEEWEISLKRARAVYNFLIRNGIDPKRLSYKSFGSTRPIYPLPEKNEQERVANRRVEIEILQQ